MGRTTRTLTVSLPPRTYKDVERLARAERKTKSELFRDMVKAYQERLEEERWSRFRKLGRRTASDLGIASEDDIEKLIHEVRGIKVG